ncbi:MAG TPA: hypothetical protein VJB14_02255, partial [Planctomycetota bacterium]|nr:hypothetical protein [Planctomycetota bacterium]
MDVIVKENLYRWANWTIEQKSHDFTKEDARTVHFPVTVGKDADRGHLHRALHLVAAGAECHSAWGSRKSKAGLGLRRLPPVRGTGQACYTGRMS